MSFQPKVVFTFLKELGHHNAQPHDRINCDFLEYWITRHIFRSQRAYIRLMYISHRPSLLRRLYVSGILNYECPLMNCQINEINTAWQAECCFWNLSLGKVNWNGVLHRVHVRSRCQSLQVGKPLLCFIIYDNMRCLKWNYLSVMSACRVGSNWCSNNKCQESCFSISLKP